MPEPTRHKLLQRQLRRAFGDVLPEDLTPFIQAVNEAYLQHEDDRMLLERSLELTSDELMARNERLREELEARARMQLQLEHELREHKRTAEALRRNKVRLDEAQRIAGVGYWEWKVHSGVAVWSDETFRIFGYEPGSITPSHTLFLEMCHDEDLDALTEAVLNARPGESDIVTFRITRADGEVRILRASGELVSNGEGMPRHVFGICLDVTEQHLYEQALIEARDTAEAAQQRAEEMLRLKTSLLNNISHELRTPLTSILGFADVLQGEVEPEQREYVDFIIQSGRRLRETFNSVLTLAQLDSGIAQLTPEPVDLVCEVQSTLDLLRPQAEAKGLPLQLRTSLPQLACSLDRSALHRTLMNLVSNAIKFTDSGAITIFLELTPTNQATTPSLQLQVHDTGIGIHPDFLPRLFSEFEQASSGDERRYEGVGLGLSITKRLVDLMGGTIAVTSEVLQGTTVTVTLPVAHAAETQPLASPSAEATSASYG